MKKIYSLFLITLAFNSCGEKKSVSIEELVSNGNLKELIAVKRKKYQQTLKLKISI